MMTGQLQMITETTPALPDAAMLTLTEQCQLLPGNDTRRKQPGQRDNQ